MPPLSILILSDGRPGHYHLSEGIASALARRRTVTVTTLSVTRSGLVPGRALASALKLGVPPALILRLGYGLSREAVLPADLVISAGGDTIAANVAAARLAGAANIFCGTLRHLAPEDFDLVVSSYARHASLPRHLVTLKPNGIDPDSLPRRRSGQSHAPAVCGLLVGGPSGLFHWRDEEWGRLTTFLGECHAALGTRWVVSTSRRTPDAVADLLQGLAADPGGPIIELIDFRSAGPGTLPRLFGSVDAILATEDSSTMLSEAVCARLPVVGVAPAAHDFKDEEREYRALMTKEGWCRSLPLAALTPQNFVAALAEVRPLSENHLDRLADALEARLGKLFAQRLDRTVLTAEVGRP